MSRAGRHAPGQSQLPKVSVEGMSVVCVVRYVRMISATRFARSRFSLCLREQSKNLSIASYGSAMGGRHASLSSYLGEGVWAL